MKSPAAPDVKATGTQRFLVCWPVSMPVTLTANSALPSGGTTTRMETPLIQCRAQAQGFMNDVLLATSCPF